MGTYFYPLTSNLGMVDDSLFFKLLIKCRCSCSPLLLLYAWVSFLWQSFSMLFLFSIGMLILFPKRIEKGGLVVVVRPWQQEAKREGVGDWGPTKPTRESLHPPHGLTSSLQCYLLASAPIGKLVLFSMPCFVHEDKYNKCQSYYDSPKIKSMIN